MCVVEQTSERTDRVLVVTAACLAAMSVVCCAAAIPLRQVVGADVVPGAAAPPDLVLATVWPLVGALVVRAQPRNIVGWLMVLPSLMGVYELLGIYAGSSGGKGFLGGVAAWVNMWGFAPYFFTLPLLPHVFPDGRPLNRRWAWVVRAAVAAGFVTLVARMFSPVTGDIARIENPLGIASAEWLKYVTLVGAISLFFIGIPLAVTSLALRMRRAPAVERTQLEWLFLGGIFLVVGVMLPLGEAAEWGLAVGLFGLPIGIGIAMLRHRLFDVELTLNRTLVFGVLTGTVVAVYAGVVYGIQLFAPGSRWGVLLVAAAALVAAAGRDRVQQLVDRMLFGHRHNPYAVVAKVGRHVAAASQPLDALQRLVDGLRSALRLPYVAFTGNDISVTSGSPVHGSRVVPVEALGEAVGELHVGLRGAREKWTPEETAAIEEVAARAGTLAYAAGLVVDVTRSRGRIVAAREEERRRLRADLHDGVAPALAGTALQLDSLARRMEREDLSEQATKVVALRDSIRATVTELRAIVHGLRPPVLDQLGLAGALRDLVTGHEMPRCVDEVGDLGAPPAALEVAAYAIGSEAFSNALRHSAASRIVVAAYVDQGDLVVSVADNGVGLPPRPRAGVGLVSMRDRAAEVGGSLEMGQTPGGGTTVTARLPLEVA
jgi:signal transduction histidine kinase